MAVTNGWGKGVENNTIGWGKAADNATNGFGAVYASSAAGDTLLGSGGAPSYDPDAVVYFTAVEDAGGELTLLEKDLVNTWFVTERAAERLSKYKAVYPFKGKNSAAAAINMVNPSTYDLTFTNFVTADFAVSGTLKGDGSTKYARMDTKIADVLQSANDSQFAAYCNSTVGINGSMLGAQDSLSGAGEIINIIQGSTDTIASVGATTQAAFTNTPQEGDSYIGTRYSSTDLRLYENGVQVDQDTTASSGTLPETEHVTFFARERQGPIYTFYSDAEHSGFWLGEGFVHADISDLDENFKAMLVDKDAQAYIQEVFDQGGSLTLAQQHAVNNLVKSMKANGLWDGAINIVPFMGGTANSSLTEIKTRAQYGNANFVDADASNSIGLTGDGSTKYAFTSETIDALMSGTYDIQMLTFADGTSGIGGNGYLAGIQSTNYRYALRITSQLTAYGGGLVTDTATALIGSESNALVRTSQTSLYALGDGVEGAEYTTSVTEVLPSVRFGLFGRGSAEYSGTMKGFVLAETWSLEQTKRFEKLYKAFIQQVQDSETYDTDAAAYFQAVEDAGGTLTDNVKDEFDAFVVREKAGGRWGKLKRLYPYLGGVIDSARIDAITNSQATNTNFVDADVDATIGLQGDGSTKYLTEVSTYSSIVSSQYKVQQGAIYIGATGETSIPYLFGAINSGNYIASRYFSSSLIRSYVGLVSPYSQYAATIPTSASVVAARYSTTSAYTIVNNNTDLHDTSTTTYSFPAVAPSYFKANGAGGISNGKYSCHFISEFDTLQETKDFTTSYKTFLTNINVI